MCVCIDIDECADENGGCSDTCTNMVGTFTCGCPDGQELAADFRNCILSKRTIFFLKSGSFIILSIDIYF